LGASYTADAKGVIAAAAIDDVADLIRGGCTLLPAYHNLFATTDPGASNDHSQDYSVGSRWVNTIAGRIWTCLSAATGAASWALDGVAPQGGTEPSNIMTAFGGGSDEFLSDGNLIRLVGNPFFFNDAATTDDVLASYVTGIELRYSGRGLWYCPGRYQSDHKQQTREAWFNARFPASVTGGSVIADTGSWVNGTIRTTASDGSHANVFNTVLPEQTPNTHKVWRSSAGSMAGLARRCL
jgi:hypothetical protein